jgi:hypothetical protein
MTEVASKNGPGSTVCSISAASATRRTRLGHRRAERRGTSRRRYNRR